MNLFMLLLIGLNTVATVRGVVRTEETQAVIATARIEIPALQRTVLTDEHGVFVITDVPAGKWQLTVSALGHTSHTVTIVSAESGTIELDFELAVQPVQLRPVEGRSGAGVASPVGSPVDAAGPPLVRIAGGEFMRNLPGVAEPDVLRAVQLLPAVAAISDYSSGLYVRGSAADATLITLSGIPLFNPYHLGGLFSAIGADAVESVDVWSGAMPAGSADRLAGAVHIRPRTGSRDSTNASGMIGMLSAHATVDGPLPGDGSYLLSGRRTYVDAASRGAYALGVTDYVIPYGFSDVLGHAVFPTRGNGRLTLTGYLDREGIDVPERMIETFDNSIQFRWGSRMAGATFALPLRRDVLLSLRTGYSDFTGNFDAWSIGREGSIACDEFGTCDESQLVLDTTQVIVAETAIRDVLAEAGLTWTGRAHRISGGVRADVYSTNHMIAGDEDLEEYVPFISQEGRTTTLAAHLEDDWQLRQDLDVRLGVRVLTATGLGHAVLPRFGIRYEISPAVAVSFGGGRYAQVIRSMRDDEAALSSLIAYDVFALQPREAGLAIARDLVAGLEWRDFRSSVRIDGYIKDMNNLVLSPRPDSPHETPVLLVDSFRIGTGTARGVELLARRNMGRLDVGLSYAFSATSRTSGGVSYAPRFERRHRLDATAMLGIGETGVASASFAWGTGQPFTPGIGTRTVFQYDGGTDGWLGGRTQVVMGDHNSGRLKGYSRLDVAYRKAYAKHWFGRDMTITPFLQVLNVLNTTNVLVPQPTTNGKAQFTYWPQLPVLPTFGLEWSF